MIITIDNIDYYYRVINTPLSDDGPIVWFNDFEEPVISLQLNLYRADEKFTSLGKMPLVYCTEKETMKQAVERSIRAFLEPSDESAED